MDTCPKNENEIWIDTKENNSTVLVIDIFLNWLKKPYREAADES
jgi:hypothetical protein